MRDGEPSALAERHRPIVAALGSCRVTRPLARLESRGLIRTIHRDAAWYTHSTRDALQKLDIVCGRRVLDDREIDLVVHGRDKWQPAAHRPDFFAAADCFVVEISSLKTVEYGGLEIQQWCLRDLVQGLGASLADLMALLALPPARRPASGIAAMPPGLVQDIAAKARAGKQSASDCIADLGRLQARLGKPAVYVPHLNVRTEAGRMLPDRLRLVRALRQFCARRGQAFFDPAPLIAAAGQAAALQDIDHYRPEFEIAVGEALYASIGRCLPASVD